VFRRVVNNTPEKARVSSLCLFCSKPYGLVVKNIVRAFKKIFSRHDLILKISSFPYYEVVADKIDCKKPCKVKVTSVKAIICIRLVRNLVHGIHVMNSCFSNVKECWDLSNNIIKGMYLNTALCLAKFCPLEKGQAQIYRNGIEGIESSYNYKLFSDTLTLSDRYHFLCKFLKDLTVPVRICFGKIAARYNRLTETEMVRFGRMIGYFTDKLSKTLTTGQLTIHHDKKLIPATKRLDVFVPLIFLNDLIKTPFWKKLNELTENIFSLIHNIRLYISDAIYDFKSTRWNINCIFLTI